MSTLYSSAIALVQLVPASAVGTTSGTIKAYCLLVSHIGTTVFWLGLVCLREASRCSNCENQIRQVLGNILDKLGHWPHALVSF